MPWHHGEDIAMNGKVTVLHQKPCPWERPGEPHHVDVTDYENYPRMVSCTMPSCPLYARVMTLEKWNNR